MWPFNKPHCSRKSEQCEHEWETYEKAVMNGENLYFEHGEQMIYRTVINERKCEYCGKIEQLNSEDEYLYVSVENVEK